MRRYQGFLLIELSVAMVIFCIFAAATLRLTAELIGVYQTILDRTNMLNILQTTVESGDHREIGMFEDGKYEVMIKGKDTFFNDIVVSNVCVCNNKGHQRNPLMAMVVDGGKNEVSVHAY